MEIPNPATPAQAATPGSNEQVTTPPASTPASATPANGNTPAGTVVISTEEYARLNRDAARGRSPKNHGRVYSRPNSQPTNFDPNDPNADAIAEANRAREEAERRAMQAEVKGKLRDLLGDERFKGIPEQTKKLILDAPHAITQAETLEDAMYDIEDKLIELAGTPATTTPNDITPPATVILPSAPSRETPPAVSPGSPAPVDAGVLEDTSTLRGTDRSQAALRNAFKKANPGG